jgi:regulatory protein
MIVTAVERRRGRPNQVDVYVDGELAFSVDRAAAAQRSLRPGQPIEQPEVDALVAAEARRSAMQTAVAALARRPRSERELRQRLARRKC